MDPEVKKMLEEDLALNKENNTILKGIRSAQRRAQIMKIVYWLIILGFTFGAYYFIQPYINSLLGYYGNIAGIAGDGDTVGKTSSMPNLNQIQDLLKQYSNAAK